MATDIEWLIHRAKTESVYVFSDICTAYGNWSRVKSGLPVIKRSSVGASYSPNLPQCTDKEGVYLDSIISYCKKKDPIGGMIFEDLYIKGYPLSQQAEFAPTVKQLKESKLIKSRATREEKEETLVKILVGFLTKVKRECA